MAITHLCCLCEKKNKTATFTGKVKPLILRVLYVKAPPVVLPQNPCSHCIIVQYHSTNLHLYYIPCLTHTHAQIIFSCFPATSLYITNQNKSLIATCQDFCIIIIYCKSTLQITVWPTLQESHLFKFSDAPEDYSIQYK